MIYCYRCFSISGWTYWHYDRWSVHTYVDKFQPLYLWECFDPFERTLLVVDYGFQEELSCVSLTKPDTNVSFGFGIIRDISTSPSLLKIAQITPGGIADVDGRLRVGNRLLQVLCYSALWFSFITIISILGFCRTILFLLSLYWPLCQEEEETALHLPGRCSTLSSTRSTLLGLYHVNYTDLVNIRWFLLLKLAKASRRFL